MLRAEAAAELGSQFLDDDRDPFGDGRAEGFHAFGRADRVVQVAVAQVPDDALDVPRRKAGLNATPFGGVAKTLTSSCRSTAR